MEPRNRPGFSDRCAEFMRLSEMPPFTFQLHKQFLRRFVVGVLGDEFALDGEGEDGFAEVGGGDGVGRVEEEREVGRGGRVGKAGQRRAGERGVPRLPFLLLRLQPITQRHQLIHLRHDPLLLGEGWEGNCGRL